MLNDLIGLLFIVAVIVAMYFFMRPKIKVGSKVIVPDALSAALLKKQIREGNKVVDVPNILIVGRPLDNLS